MDYSAPQVRDTPEPFVSSVRAALSGRTRELERLAVELYARGLSTRDIEDAFTDETGRRLLSRAAVSEITEKLWAEYEDFCRRDLSESAVAYLFIDGVAERLRPGQRREAVLAAWGIGEDGRKSLLGLMAGSGRASCAGPNLQQIPHSRRFRELFIPEPGHVFVVADYSSMELRAAAHISNDRAMTEAFKNGLDLHKITAARMTGKALADVTPEERKAAKSVNFGAIYGQGANGLVQSAWVNFDQVLELAEAQAWLTAFENAYPQFTQWRRDHYLRCEERGYVVIGRDAEARGIGRIFPRSRVPEGGSYYTRCCNLPIQGACADAAMLALAYVDDRLFEAGIDGGPVAWLHDEIVIEVREDQAERAAEILKQSMIDGFAETFPGAPLNGLVEPHIGLNWGEAKAGEITNRLGRDARAATSASPLPSPSSFSSAMSARTRPGPGRSSMWPPPAMALDPVRASR